MTSRRHVHGVTSMSWNGPGPRPKADRMMVGGHEFQRVAPACWAATLLLCGGVPRVMTRPDRSDRASASSRSRPDDHRGSDPEYPVGGDAADGTGSRGDAVHEHARRCGEARSRVRSVARGRPGRAPPVRRRWATSRSSAAGCIPRVQVAYETWGRLNDAGRQRDPRRARPHRGQPRRRPGRTRRTRRRAGGTGSSGRAARSTPTGGSSSRPTSSAGARARPGPSSLAPRRATVGEPVPVRHGARPGHGRGPAGGRDRASPRWAAVLGGSMGGMRVLEWAVTHPDRVDRALVLASTAYASADQIAWCQPQLLAIRSDPHFRGGDYYDEHDRFAGPETGLGIARRIAHVTYRSGTELDDRFGREPQGRRGAARRTGAATPSSPTSTTTRPSCPAGSTRTPTSSSPRR